ncbi:alpha/beta fold hydrolase [Flavobacterium sp.]|uniref:alpha/beta hydrolase family protein n=1 Tax=Flavobacterium sp. TaxID=239 RepID=UPI00286DBDFB|nr:alpha/beta fold hydrolase [Flavobacterium sp.]
MFGNRCKTKFYSKFAQYMQEHNITVITFDYAGIGGSLKTNIKNIKNSVYDWANNDLDAILEHCKNTYPNQKLTLLGHSIGGQLIGLTEKSLTVNKIILVNAQSGYWGFWTGFQKVKMWLNWNVLFPSLINVFGYMPSKKISGMENLPKNVANQWKNWCNSKNYLFDFLSYDSLYYDKISCDLFSYSVDDDNYAPQKSVDWLTSKTMMLIQLENTFYQKTTNKIALVILGYSERIVKTFFG